MAQRGSGNDVERGISPVSQQGAYDAPQAYSTGQAPPQGGKEYSQWSYSEGGGTRGVGGPYTPPPRTWSGESSSYGAPAFSHGGGFVPARPSLVGGGRVAPPSRVPTQEYTPPPNRIQTGEYFGAGSPVTSSPVTSTSSYSTGYSGSPINAHGGGFIPGQHQSYAPGISQAPPAQSYAPQAEPIPAKAPVYGVHETSNGTHGYTQQAYGESGFGEKRGIADTAPHTQTKRTYQRGYRNLFNAHAKLRWKYPHSYQMPGIIYTSLARGRHRDIMQRVWEGPEDDRYLSPWDGHVAKLVVQATDDVYNGALNSTWRRTFIRNISPSYIKVANFPFTKVPADRAHWTSEDWASVCIRWPVAVVGLLFVLMSGAGGSSAPIRHHGGYDPFVYRYWGYAKVSRNPRENPPPYSLLGTNAIGQRILGPRYLCFLESPGDRNMRGVTVQKVDDYIRQHGKEADTRYLFIGYTTAQFDHGSNEDMQDLHFIAERAAREAGVPAYWVACSCMPDPTEMEDDVHRISDVMRSCDGLIIAVGPSRFKTGLRTRDEMLKMWGERMWTLPEALLSPSGVPIKVYMRGGDGDPWHIAKKDFARVVWNDPLISRQLVEHYDSNLHLTRLELVTIALKCLASRDTTNLRFKGDLSYALMGLLRQRPVVDSTDSDFQAFARLSLANDSDMLLERLVCTLPPNPNAPWLHMDDAWNVSLWDIYPTTQVSGVGHDDTVILDGAFGAAIRWKAFAHVLYIKRGSWKRLGARLLLHYSPVIFLIGCVMIAFGLGPVGAILLVISLVILCASPHLIKVIYGGKLWGQQAWFFGFEGYMDLATIESHIFGAYNARLHWSPSGSSISRHEKNEFGECVGIDPTLDPAVAAMVEAAKTAEYGGMKIFTLVDTLTLTVTMFAAVRAPVAVLICGREGGMQRAVMASYDWKSGTMYRETVLRMETPVLGRMFRVNRFKFGFKRPMSQVQRLVGNNM